MICFLRIAPGRYQPIWPVYIADWGAKALKARWTARCAERIAAFHAYLIGSDPHYRVHVLDRLLHQHDGNMLEALKVLTKEGFTFRADRLTIRIEIGWRSATGYSRTLL